MTARLARPVPLSFGYDAPEPDLPALAREAMEHGRQALDSGRHASAARWFDRACRLLPGDPTLKLLLATACLRADPERAKRLWHELAETQDSPVVRAGLAAAGCDLPVRCVSSAATPPPGQDDASRRSQAIRFRRQQQGRDSVLIITHADGGGVERRIATRIATHEAQGHRAVVLRPESDWGVRVSDGDADRYPKLRFGSHERPVLLRLLRAAKPVRAEIHHLLGHDPAITSLPDRLGIPYTVHVHDHGWICPRIVLIDPAGRYCGEPDPPACDACIAKGGTAFDEVTSIAAFRERSGRILSAAERVIAPSTDAAARLRRYMPAQSVAVIPHEYCAPSSATPSRTPHHICVIGALGIHKGFRVLLDCAEDAAAREIPLRFTVIGTTIDDASLIRTGRVFITGGFAPQEADALIRAQRAMVAWLPSIWPETWCFALSDAWRAGLNVAVFDIGAQAERVRATGRGTLLPLGLSPAQINNALLALSGASVHEDR